MSLRRQRVPFRKYAEVPSRDTTRFKETSAKPAYWPPSVPSELSNTSSTDAWPTGLREPEPLKMTSAIESPRRCFAEISPMTQRTASMMFDLPQPLGPTTPTRLLGKLIVVGSTKDLKPASLILVRRIVHPGEGAGEERAVYKESGAPHSIANAPVLGLRQCRSRHPSSPAQNRAPERVDP